MTTSSPAEGMNEAPAALRSIEAAALAGLAYAALFLTSTYLLLRAPRSTTDATYVSWHTDVSNQRSTVIALNMMAVGMIAFVWFVAVIRRRVGERENRFFGTVFLGSALLLAGTQMIAYILLATPTMSAYRSDVVPGENDVALWQASGLTLLTVVGTRLEAVFIISTTTVGRLSEAMPKQVLWLGYLAGAVLLIVPLSTTLLIWLFPLWVIVVSASMLVRRHLRLADAV